MGDSQYSFSLTTFSPSGKLVQIEHALTAVGSGQTSLGIKAAPPFLAHGIDRKDAINNILLVLGFNAFGKVSRDGLWWD
ncbi:hypothetical protein GUJ93_ZPchr0002g26270 [Zizania palustris]|uniref:Proteasome alpha-type subunits domain-containing protein n=1 Tax=Zizania palustris TaxID=103762 RepID=A0A8J5VU52_ZIZPA|nr:hypothetical protein GUJ93_ZPchr0002g26270 [Zizania palustris]